MVQYHRDSWTLKTMEWRDKQDCNSTMESLPFGGPRPLRARPGRWRRWEDALVRFADAHSCAFWKDKAQEKEVWEAMSHNFVKDAAI